MKPIQAPCRFRPWGWLALAALVALTGHARLSAQEPVLLLSDTPKAPEKAKTDVLLRPNLTEHTQYLFVKNPEDKALTVTVALRGGPTDNTTDVLRSKPIVFTGQGTLPVAWETGPMATAVPPAAGTTLPAPVDVELKDPSQNKFHLVILENDKPLGTSVPIFLQQPEDYLELQGMKQCFVKFDGKARVTAKVSSNKEFVGKPAPVQLVLDPARIPGLALKETTDASTTRSLTGPEKSVELYQGNLSLEYPENKELGGPVTITVDGFGRALTYRTKFKEGVEEDAIREDQPILRIQCDRYGKTGDKFPVTLLVDNAKLAWNLEVGVDRNKDGTFEEDEVQVLTGAREQHVFVRPGTRDALVFRTVVKDWKVELETGGIFGSTSVRLQLLNEKGEPITVHLGKKVEPVVQTVTFDNSRPEILSFGLRDEKKVNHARNAPIELKVTAEDGLSRIKEVVFFVGKSTAEIPMPPGVDTVPGVFTKDDKAKDAKDMDLKGELPEKGMWVAQLPAPTDKGGKIPIGVQVTNGAGIKTFGTITLELVEPGKAGNGGAGGGGKESITGTVKEDGRKQPKLTVQLKDPMGNVKATTKTDDNGRYAFTDVPTGAYKVTVEKTASKTYGEVAVTVVDGVPLSGVDISLGRK